MAIKSIALRSKASPNDGKEPVDRITVGRTVAFYVSNWNKWIRCVVRAKDSNGTHYLWAQDYGVPMIGQKSDVISLPLSFAGKTIKNMVHLGGLMDCVPAEKIMDFNTGDLEMVVKRSWSPQAIEALRNTFNSCVEMEFKDVREFRPMQKRHLFGRLMVRTKKNLWFSATKVLLTLQYANVSHNHWDNIVRNHDSLQQVIWKTIDGIPLYCKLQVVPHESGNIVDEIDETENDLEAVNENDDEFNDDTLSRIDINRMTIEDEKFFDASASCVGGMRVSENRSGNNNRQKNSGGNRGGHRGHPIDFGSRNSNESGRNNNSNWNGPRNDNNRRGMNAQRNQNDNRNNNPFRQQFPPPLLKFDPSAKTNNQTWSNGKQGNSFRSNGNAEHRSNPLNNGDSKKNQSFKDNRSNGSAENGKPPVKTPSKRDDSSESTQSTTITVPTTASK